MTMKKKEMAALFDELGEYALETEVAPIGEQSDRDSKKLVEIALLASASTFDFCSGIAEGSVSMPLGGKQERYHALVRILQLAFGMEAKDSKCWNDGGTTGMPLAVPRSAGNADASRADAARRPARAGMER